MAKEESKKVRKEMFCEGFEMISMIFRRNFAELICSTGARLALLVLPLRMEPSFGIANPLKFLR